jgi:general secretion pathway protein D
MGAMGCFSVVAALAVGVALPPGSIADLQEKISSRAKTNEEGVASEAHFQKPEGPAKENARFSPTFFLETDEFRRATEKDMVDSVGGSWNVGNAVPQANLERTEDGDDTSLFDKLSTIVVPRAQVTNVELSHVVKALESIAEQNGGGAINMVIIGLKDAEREPIVNLSLRNVSLYRLIELVAKSAAFHFDVTRDAVIFYPRDSSVDMVETDFFPLPRAALIRMTGMRGINHRGRGISDSDETTGDGERALLEFFQRAGVNFSDVPGCSMAFDGSQIIVTNTCRNLKKIRNILKKYEEVRQVEIEAKFLEVQQGALEELGFRWQLGNRNNDGKFFQTGNAASGTGYDNLRTLAGAFAPSNFSMGNGQIVSAVPPVTTPINNSPPGLPGQINVGTFAVPIASFTGVISKLQCDVMIRALEQHDGSDLMSAPKVTVLSGKTAEIIVAMEVRYPQKYGDMHSEVGAGTVGFGVSSAAGVTITAGTPQDFTARNVGVEMLVTPTVEADGSISLQLGPKVTEFEGFVEYGGMSIAANSQTTVSVPSGFYQPIFSTREIHTEVNIFDGATVVMGGLTREEVKEVHDKVPILGDIPLLGRLFRSKSETSQKRNLLIFVSAHSVSPFGEQKINKDHSL